MNLEIAVFIWLGLLTILSIWIILKFVKLIKILQIDPKTKMDIISRLALLNRDIRNNHRLINENQGEISKLMEDDLKNIDIIKVKKFQGLAGDVAKQSFSVLMLNRNLNGVIITSLDSKNVNRLLIREILKGRASEKLLTEEEELLSSVKKEG